MQAKTTEGQRAFPGKISGQQSRTSKQVGNKNAAIIADTFSYMA